MRRPGQIRPRANYLKVIGDFCRWNDHIVFGCDDTARNEFLNTRKAKGEISAPQSQSNLWFVDPAQLDDLGPVKESMVSLFGKIPILISVHETGINTFDFLFLAEINLTI